MTALSNVDPLYADAYAQTYYKNDALNTPVWSIAPGEVRACSYTHTDSFRASAYYDEFVFANAKAEDLVRRQTGLRYERGQLAAATPALTHRLHALARAGSWPGRGNGEIGGTLEISRGENRQPLVAHVIPLAANRVAAVVDIDRPAAAVFIVDPAAGPGAQIQRFAARFGLTPAETRVLAEIIGGNGLLAAAARLNITYATAREHAKRILSKTGTTRQTELIRRFFETALPGSPAGA